MVPFIWKNLSKTRDNRSTIIATVMGNVLHIGEPDCSMQRRHQKLIEDPLRLALTPEIRAALAMLLRFVNKFIKL